MIFYAFVSKSFNCNCIYVLCVKGGGYDQALQFVTVTLCMNIEVKRKRSKHQKSVPILQTCWCKGADKQVSAS